MGEWALKNLQRGGYPGNIYPVNPRYESLFGLPCYPGMAALPEVADLVIFAVADNRIEALLDEAIAFGVPAVVLMSTLVIEDDGQPPLKARVQHKIREAGTLVCGANGMGFYNVRDRVWACGFDSRLHEPPGNVSLISHSGSGMSGIIDSEERIRINFAVSTGNEIGVSMDDYLDFALDLPETRVVGLFVETARNPEGFRAALDKSQRRRIPLVALKVGRTSRSAQMTVSHSGAMAGDDATYSALFDRYGVTRVRDMDELATTLILMAELHPVGAGGLVTLHDSGGERQLLIDLAEEARVPLTDINAETAAALEKVLDPALPAVNPLDAWSRGGDDAANNMARCLTLLMHDPQAAMGAVVHDRAPDGLVYSSYIDYMRRARHETGKPVALVAARQGTGCDRQAVAATHAGLPVLDGIPAFLVGVRALFRYRDFLAGKPIEPPAVPKAVAKRWGERLREGSALGEAESLDMLREFDLPVNAGIVVDSERALADAANGLAFPLAMKTAAADLPHKTEHGGVVLGLDSGDALRSAYREMSGRLGPRVLVAPMIQGGVEMILGARRDPQFGPVVMLGFGGIYAEVLQDVVFCIPPFDAATARRRLDGLRLRPLLDAHRGRQASAVDAFCDMAARFSSMVHALGDSLQEIDINPVIVTHEHSVAVDALVVGRKSKEKG
jgi:acyl-CoA synthetase (NDP forming)